MRHTSVIRFIAGIMFCAAGFTVQAQDTLQKPRHHHHSKAVKLEAGANLLPLTRAIFNQNTDTIGLSPYLINARVSWGHFGIRGSIGGHYSQKATYVAGFRDSDITNRSGFYYRAGLDYRSKFSRRFSGSVGLDWVSQHTNNTRKVDSGFDIIETIQLNNTMGGGISLGAQYWLNKRLGMGIETSAYFMAGEAQNGRKFVNFPELNDELNTIEIKELQFPVGVFLIWRI